MNTCEICNKKFKVSKYNPYLHLCNICSKIKQKEKKCRRDLKNYHYVKCKVTLHYCERCGATYMSRGNNKRVCDICRKLRKAELNHKRFEENYIKSTGPKVKINHCLKCGKEIKTWTNINQRLCKSCYKLNQKEAQRTWRQKNLGRMRFLNRRWREKHKEIYNERCRKNEARREYQRQYALARYYRQNPIELAKKQSNYTCIQSLTKLLLKRYPEINSSQTL